MGGVLSVLYNPCGILESGFYFLMSSHGIQRIDSSATQCPQQSPYQ